MAALRPGRCRLAEHLKRSGMTQAELARRIGVSEKMVSKYVNGENIMSYFRAKQVAHVLRIAMEDLYD